MYIGPTTCLLLAALLVAQAAPALPWEPVKAEIPLINHHFHILDHEVDAPILDSISASGGCYPVSIGLINCNPTSAGIILTFHGAQFGFSGSTVSSVCIDSPVHSPQEPTTVLTCRLKPGFPASVIPLAVTDIAGRISHPLQLIYGPITCFDGLMNGAEQGIDCAGECGVPCSPGSSPVLDRITSIGCAQNGIGLKNCPLVGGAELTFHGSNFLVGQTRADMVCSSDIQHAVGAENEQFTCLMKATHMIPRSILVLVSTYFGRSSSTVQLSYAQSPLCLDGIKNGEETDVDCGGSKCNACLLDRPALISITASAVCIPDGNNLIYCPPSGRDHLNHLIILTFTGQNFGYEGGLIFQLCAEGSAYHTFGREYIEIQCILAPAPSGTRVLAQVQTYKGTTAEQVTVEYNSLPCYDGVLNQDETNVDCGGVCGPCIEPCITVYGAGFSDANQQYTLISPPSSQFEREYVGTVGTGWQLIKPLLSMTIPTNATVDATTDVGDHWQLWYRGQQAYAAVLPGSTSQALQGGWVVGLGLGPAPQVTTGCDQAQPVLSYLSGQGCVEPPLRTGDLYCPSDGTALTNDGTSTSPVSSPIVLFFHGSQFGMYGAQVSAGVCQNDMPVTHQSQQQSTLLSCVMSPMGTAGSGTAEQRNLEVVVSVQSVGPDGIPQLFSSQTLHLIRAPLSCFNGVQDVDELGLDCGLLCVPCACTLPGAPMLTHVQPGQQEVAVFFDPPVNTGGSPIDYYQALSYPGGHVAYGRYSPLLVSDLTPGVPYTFTLRAVNSGEEGVSLLFAGNSLVLPPSSVDTGGRCGVTGPPSDMSPAVTPLATIPQTPFSVRAVGDRLTNDVAVTFQNRSPGGSGQALPVASFIVTQYLHVVGPGGYETVIEESSFQGMVSPVIRKGLSTGKLYTFTVMAVDTGGQRSTPSAHSNLIQPGGGLPSPPIIGPATAGNGLAYVTYTAPVNAGFSEIVLYTATSSPEGKIGTALSGPITVTGLTNGVAYTFTVTASNGAGMGEASAPSAPVTPANTVPGPPLVLDATGGDGQVSVFFDPPAETGGNAILSYRVTAIMDEPGQTEASHAQEGTVSPMTVRGLTNERYYKVSILAVNSLGAGIPTFWPTRIRVTFLKPGPPIMGTATAGAHSATVTFVPPSLDGGIPPITSFTLIGSPSIGGALMVQGTSSPLTVTGLTNGQPYVFTVYASNSAGAGSPSRPSNVVVPGDIRPSAPVVGGVSSLTKGQLTLSFTPPLFDGGAAITSYEVATSPGKFLFTAAASPITIKGLDPLISYTLYVAAFNAAGRGPYSSGTLPMFPVGRAPLAPLVLTATPGNQAVTLVFLPAELGPPASYFQATSSPGGMKGRVDGNSPLTVSGLSNGVAYTFTVEAVNEGGSSDPSNRSPAATPEGTSSGAPLMVSAVGGNAAVTVWFEPPPFDGNLPITHYTLHCSNGQNQQVSSSPGTMVGLMNGKPYSFTVSAHNAKGVSPRSALSQPATALSFLPGQASVDSVTAGLGYISVDVSPATEDQLSSLVGYQLVVNPVFENTLFAASPALLEQFGYEPRLSVYSVSPNAITVKGLMPGLLYQVSAAAINAQGTGAFSAPKLATPAAGLLPGPPEITSWQKGSGAVSVFFQPPLNIRDAGIVLNYTVQAFPSGATASGTHSPLTVTGLTNGLAYTFRVRAASMVGIGLYSERTVPIAPDTLLPAAPLVGLAVASSQSATLLFAPPVSSSFVSKYIVITQDSGDVPVAEGVLSPVVIRPLVNGRRYVFAIAAVNQAGQGAFSSFSNAVYPAATLPLTPLLGSATADNQFAMVSFLHISSPLSTVLVGGGAGGDVVPLVDRADFYTAQAYEIVGGGSTITGENYAQVQQQGDSTVSPVSVFNLENDRSYQFTLTATNALGTSPPSVFTNVVTPTGRIPTAPLLGVAWAGRGIVSVWFEPPTSNGGAPLLNYTAVTNTGKSITGPSSPLTILGLVNGSPVTVTVRTSNKYGISPSSVVSLPVTPLSALPLRPSIVKVQAYNGEVAVDFVADPLDDLSLLLDPFFLQGGEGAVRYYRVTSTPGNHTAWGPAAPLTVTGLTNGVWYTFSVVAANVRLAANVVLPPSSTPGTSSAARRPLTVYSISAASVPSEAVSPVGTLAGAPVMERAVSAVNSALVYFSPPSTTGGLAITQYQVISSSTVSGQSSDAPPLVHVVVATGTASPITVPGLVQGREYTFQVLAVNSRGPGPPSAPSNTIYVVSLPPNPPASITAVPGPLAGEATLTFPSSVSPEGPLTTVLHYLIRISPPVVDATAVRGFRSEFTTPSSPLRINGLQLLQEYTATVLAVTATGGGLPSAPSPIFSSVFPPLPVGAKRVLLEISRYYGELNAFSSAWQQPLIAVLLPGLSSVDPQRLNVLAVVERPSGFGVNGPESLARVLVDVLAASFIATNGVAPSFSSSSTAEAYTASSFQLVQKLQNLAANPASSFSTAFPSTRSGNGVATGIPVVTYLCATGEFSQLCREDILVVSPTPGVESGGSSNRLDSVWIVLIVFAILLVLVAAIAIVMLSNKHKKETAPMDPETAKLYQQKTVKTTTTGVTTAVPIVPLPPQPVDHNNNRENQWRPETFNNGMQMPAAPMSHEQRSLLAGNAPQYPTFSSVPPHRQYPNQGHQSNSLPPLSSYPRQEPSSYGKYSKPPMYDNQERLHSAAGNQYNYGNNNNGNTGEYYNNNANGNNFFEDRDNYILPPPREAPQLSVLTHYN